MNERSYFIMMHSNFKCIEICHKNVEISILFLYIWMANGVLMRNFKNIKSSHFRFVCNEKGFFFKWFPGIVSSDEMIDIILWEKSTHFPSITITTWYSRGSCICIIVLKKKKKGGSHAVLILRIGNAGSDENCHFLVHK